ncbi:hypothetical protein PBT90_19905 [Algoriphagus halophytocola]|uniref:hypothetical protein n=1 Tax=Algoriphagus halophytocola TaxID=2991499 RepID=UPI0022DE09CD|nr:hypothetical protein [Algoriphagus sp. TR-M9]WBL42995.1 hypothetical protein PBT90_19905 [Algoriphagus sp. TR-M9]
MLKSSLYIWLCAVLVMNSMVYSVIKVSFTMNQKYIIDNFCINTDKPMLNCDGKCYLATKLKEEQERQENNTALTFSQDFGLYIPNPSPSYKHPENITQPIAHQAFYKNRFGQTLSKEIEHPPQG